MMQEEQPLQVLIYTKKGFKKIVYLCYLFWVIEFDYIFHPGGKMHKDN